MNGKIILIIVILLAVVSGTIGGYLYRENKKSSELAEAAKSDPLEEELPPEIGEVDISLSPVDDLVLPDLNMEQADFDLTSGFDPDLPEIFGTSSIEIEVPQPELDLDIGELDVTSVFTESAPQQSPTSQTGQQEQPSGNQQPQSGSQTAPSAAVCAQFEQAPDCSFVPVENRELCEQCRQ